MILPKEKVMMMIASVGWYTDFVRANQKSLDHSHVIIGELIKAILQQVKPPLTLVRLEGDGVFLYAVKDEAFPALAGRLGERVMDFFNVFSQKVAELALASSCKCGACTNIETLKLKVIVHSGRCAIHQIANVTFELSGVDVIIVHRLLNNSVRLNQYVLLTDAARDDLQIRTELVTKGEEVYDGIGAIPTFVYRAPEPKPYVRDPEPPVRALFLDTLRCEIQREYAGVATSPNKGFHFHTGRTLAKLLEYPDEMLKGIPEASIQCLAGTGNPFALGPLAPGERVVELGCGAGMDTLIASRMVGAEGRVVSIDMTAEMLEKAEAGAREIGATNIDFHLGYIEDIPVPDAWADVIISNGVINLAPDKRRVFAEIHRVLKPGGRLQIGDIIVQKRVPESAKRNIDLWVG